jgi:hypothetical protein
VCDHETSWYEEAIARAELQSQKILLLLLLLLIIIIMAIRYNNQLLLVVLLPEQSQSVGYKFYKLEYFERSRPIRGLSRTKFGKTQNPFYARK